MRTKDNEINPEDDDNGQAEAAPGQEAMSGIAKTLGRRGGLKGGKARAAKLTPQERSEMARNAVAVRWAKREDGAAVAAPVATHEGTVVIGELSIACCVTEDGRRLFSEREFTKSLGGKRGGSHWQRRKKKDGGADLPVFLSANNLRPYIPLDLDTALRTPILYHPCQGGIANGIEASVIPKICMVFLAARDAGALHPSQVEIARQADAMIRGLAVVGITALVDEATGYQEVRDRRALQEILDRYLRTEFAVWAKRFPDEFYKQIFRLRGWTWRGMKVNRPQALSSYTKDLVYKRLAPGLMKELEERNPQNEKGHRRAKHHQWLTEDVGHPALAQHIYALIGLMRASDTWKDFMRHVNRAFPHRGDTLEMPLFQEGTESS